MVYYLSGQKDIVAFDISFNILIKSKPKVFFCYQFSSFLDFRNSLPTEYYSGSRLFQNK